ncbi:oxidoreductase-like domain-containing protein [Paraburkholderia bryophila]|uniref:oxidoreductase-like domain-containing protein n=1 Tax=Paraburkholderia bryophila TaxID=420952 RepID=UPI00234B6D55|nr:oxidoreductase-like domain-containing protein [Paraburkholderia bryophila]WCM22718.1 oxidoreductase-like domain-containing protein [Paraburkholderia bryophila]
MPRATLRDDPQPVPPVQPDLDDCCHSGCNPCVFDLYDEALERYQAALAQWRERQAAEASVPKQTAPRRQSRPRQRRGSA